MFNNAFHIYFDWILDGRCALSAYFYYFMLKYMSSLSVVYLINVKMVKLPGDDSKYVMMTVFLKAKPKKPV